MIKLLLLAIASAVSANSTTPPCVPVASDHLTPTESAIDDHKALRKALGEPMPQASTMVMMYGRGGHHSTEEYSIVLARGADDVWRGTAVGRSQFWMKDAPYTPMKRIEWVLDKGKARKLDDAISHRCPFDRSVLSAKNLGPPPRGYIAQRIDVVQPRQSPITYYVSEGDGVVAAIIRPPE